MNTLIINGAPAVGKLAVAREISYKTGFKILNHNLTCDVSKSICQWESKEYYQLNDILWIEIFSFFIENGADSIVFTFCYSENMYQEFINRLIKMFSESRSSLYQAYLTCSPEAQRRRVIEPERKRFGKIASIEELDAFQSRRRLIEIPCIPTVHIDNTLLMPHEVAERILKHFSLFGNRMKQ